MRLAWLELTNYRSYAALTFTPEPGVNVLVGDNGTGKTNVLEAINYLSALSSFRSSPDRALIRAGEETAVVRGGVSREQGELRVEVEIPGNGLRRILVNGKRPRRHSDVAAEVAMVAFLADDLDLVKRGPARRRDFLDRLGSQLIPGVGANHADYVAAVQQRNTLLRREGRAVDPLTLDVWDERVAEAGARVVLNRLRLIHRLEPVFVASYDRFSSGGDPRIDYSSAWAPDLVADPGASPGQSVIGERLREALAARRSRDLDQGSTTVGPHRDEPRVWLGGRSTRTQASQGEQRSTALALRLAAYELLRERVGTAPILLLDDVFSELDVRRADAVRELLPVGQVFVTTARDDVTSMEGRRWRVEDGKVR